MQRLDNELNVDRVICRNDVWAEWSMYNELITFCIPDEEKEWDFEQAGRSLGMLYYYADSHGWIYNTTTNHEYPIMITLDHTNITPKSALGEF